jgi:uncharacterized protein YyaL (SSP411 family)
MSQYGAAFGHLLGAADLAVNGGLQVAIVGDAHSPPFAALARAVAAHYLPSLVLAGGAAEANTGIALLEDRPALENLPTAYVCRNYTCQLPVTEAVDLGKQLEEGE